MNYKEEFKPFFILVAIFFIFFYLPVDNIRFKQSLHEALYLLNWYTKEHVILCLIPAFFIAGFISIFFTHGSIIKYLGPKANKIVAYGVASVSGTVLAVCSCTILPLFAGIYKKGAGIGPASTFLYSGPAINVLAIILTARILGVEIGIARTVGAILFSIVIGLVMSFIFKEKQVEETEIKLGDSSDTKISHNFIFVVLTTLILVFANWGNPGSSSGFFHFVYIYKWIFTLISSIIFFILLHLLLKIKLWQILILASLPIVLAFIFPQYPLLSFGAGLIGLSILLALGDTESEEWLESSWGYAKQIFPLLFIGVFVAGFLLGSTRGQGIIPSKWVIYLVGGNSLFSNFFASITGAFMYFATLTEVPIIQGLMNNGMGKGPALSLLLAGPALSLPNMLVIKSIMGIKKTMIFIVLVIILSTITGYLYGLT
jgi:uncharacterized protein